MAAIRLEEFRLRTGITESQLARNLAVAKLSTASWIASNLASRTWGHAIESAVASGGDVHLKVYRHNLPASGKVWVSGLGVVGLTGAVSYTSLDVDTIRVASVTLASTIEGKGWLSPQFIVDESVLERMIRVTKTPVAAIEEIRLRDSDWASNGAFPSGSIISSSDYYAPMDGQESWAGEIELSTAVRTTEYQRRPGMVKPVKVRSRRTARVVYYAGCVSGVPDDVADAIAAICKEMATDPLGAFASESYDYYSYSKLSAAEIRSYPIGAVATLLRYRRAI